VLGGDNQANGAGGALWGFKRMEEPRSSRHRSGRLKLKRHRHRRSRSDSSERDVRSRTRSRSRGADSSLSRLSGAIVEGIDRLLVRSESSRVPKVSTSLVQNVIEPFDPRHHNIEEWLDAVDEFKAIYDWDDRTTSHLALNKLSGPAEVWYRGLPSRVFSWDQWRGKLLATFKIKRNLFDAMREMMACEPDQFETLYEYCFQKMALINRLKIPMNGEDQVSLIIGAIQDEHLKFAIEASGITDPNVLAMHFKTLDKKETQSNRTDAPQLRPTFRGKTDSQRPQRLTCFQCGRPGHKRKDCTQTGGETSSRNQRQRAIEYNVNYIGDKPNNKFFKPIELSGCTEICFLDLGSSVSLITKALVDKLGLEPVRVGVPVSLKTLHDSTIPVEYKVTALISIDDIAKEIDLYIVDKCVMGVEILVGQNFTELPEIYYKKQGDSLLFRELSRASQSVEEHRKVNVGTNDPKATQQLLALLDEFSMCIANDMSEVGKTSTTEMHIKLTTTQPIAYRPRRYSDSERINIRKIVDKYLRSGIIQESTSPYASPVLLVGKKNGEQRLCVDYRALNKITIKDKYPIPLIEDHLSRLAGYSWFTSLDLYSGYHQIPMARDSIPMTAFVTQDGHYEFLRVPFGLTNAPAVFQRMINTLLGNLRFTKVLIFIDDVLILARSWQESLETLKEVLNIFKRSGLTLRLSKCYFLKTKIEYLGFEVSESGIQPTNRQIEAVSEFPVPTTVHQLRQFIGLTSYFRRFISNYAVKSKPLTELLKKDVPWLWGEKQIEAFKTLKDYLVSKPILALYDQNLETRLYTDASAIGIAGILVQVRDNRENVVAYFSRHTTLNEHKYHSFELETLAIVSSVKRFRQYLLGRPFTIITDCAAVRATFSKSEVNPRVGRWVLELNEYNFTIIHRGNQQMRHVDALSRNPPTPEPAVHVVTISEEDWLLAAQQGDKELHRVREILESGEWEDNKNIFRDYALKGGKVCKITNYGLRWVVPKAAKFQILRMAHDDAGHFAFDKTYELISRQYWFPRMRRFIKKYIDNCLHCIYFKTPAGKPQGSLHPIPKIAVPFHTVHIDHVGPFVKSRQGNTEVLVAVDAFTKFVLLYPVKTTRAKHVVRALKDLTKNFGAPHRIISDGAKSFVGKVFTNFCRKRKIHHYVNAPSVPRANGQVERYNRTLLSALATMGADVDDDQWDENINNIQLGMNGTINRAIGVTPSEALMGIRVSANRMLEPGVDPVVDVTKVREAIAEKTTSYQAAQKLQFDSKRALSRSYSEGDLVMTKIVSHPATGQSKKLLPKWRGPFRITEVLPNERYRVEDIPGARRTKFRYRGVAAVDNLRPWVVFA
jgi:hypothetical protein